ncbi:MAG: signal peptidase II [Candidatus Paralactobacillus gallistercoris]|uniref:Lipoprotein signal peptidase n=1 Tax=Candidatus Paralactobacillus gallistercoris TaxID=2838724 RepID=A0A948X1K0_9LACO|nr:signal peptidase II [Candidatus Paralactobacillus gallistercoris]
MWPLVIAGIVIIMDQLFKHWIVTHIALGTSITLIPHVLSLTNIRNNGAAWSMLSGQTGFFYIITGIAVVFLTYLYFTSKPAPLYRLGLALVFAGAIGNFIDRLRFKYVVDMFQLLFINFPIFNIADVALTSGVILIIIYEIWLNKDGN